MQVIFYKAGNGNAIDKAIAWYTSSWRDKLNGKWKDSYSHVELLFRDGLMFSASQYEDKVRFKVHNYKNDNWVKIDTGVSVDDEEIAREYCGQLVGKKYDYWGVAGFVFGNRDDSNKWFCSEVVTSTLQTVGLFEGIDASKVSPNRLARILGVL